MSELVQQVLQNGQEVQNGDVNNLGLAAVMDDRVLAEVLRLLPFSGAAPAKLILPFGVDGAYGVLPTGLQAPAGTVQPSGSANGSALIAPFRAIVGSRVAPGTNALQSWREIRSGVCVGNAGVWSAVQPTALGTVQPIAANSSGLARWDVIYAVVTPDANMPAQTRAVKSPTTLAVSTGGTVTQLATTVSVGYAQGAPSASPALPALPADAGGVYYVPLAFVVVPNGWSGTSTLQPWQIMSAIPQPTGLSKALNGSFAAPANSTYAQSTSALTSAKLASWANNTGNSVSGRTPFFLPPDMGGVETIYAGLDCTNGALSHAPQTVVDNSRDWRKRLFRCFWQAGQPTGAGGHFAWDRGASTQIFGPQAQQSGVYSQPYAGFNYESFGQSFVSDGINLPGGGPGAATSVVGFVNSSQLSLITAGAHGVGLYVDQGTGTLNIYVQGNPNCILFFWIFATRPFGQY